MSIPVTPNLGLKKPTLNDLANIEDMNDNADILDTLYSFIYPVGSIYMSMNSANPSTFMPNTTWVQIKDRFLLAVGDTYSANSTGGNALKTLDVTEIPSHTHTFTGIEGDTGEQSNDHTHGYTDSSADDTSGSTALSVAQMPSHSHSISSPLEYTTASGLGAWWNRIPYGGPEPSTAISWRWGCSATGGGQGHTHSISNSDAEKTSEGVSADHTHKVTPSGTNSSVGGGQSFSILPPYQTVYMWKRTA